MNDIERQNFWSVETERMLNLIVRKKKIKAHISRVSDFRNKLENNGCENTDRHDEIITETFRVLDEVNSELRFHFLIS